MINATYHFTQPSDRGGGAPMPLEQQPAILQCDSVTRILKLTSFGKTLVTMNLNQPIHKNFPLGRSSSIGFRRAVIRHYSPRSYDV
jgi:hypothetical protein